MCIAVPGRVTSIGESTPALVPGEVTFPDRTLSVNLVMVPDVAVGDHVIVHSGYAIRIVSPETAEEATALLCPDTRSSTAEPASE
ncbi:MAG: HypC/HybG/HupF family hydrogenase formation chaperone [Actinomycetota bacterium]